MRTGRTILSAAGVLLAAAPLALAQPQTPQQLMDLQAELETLERLSQERADARRAPRAPAARPDGVGAERVAPLASAWECRNAAPNRPIHAEASPTSRVVGLTARHVPVSGAPVNGYLATITGAGGRGYVREGDLQPFRSATAPAAGCRVAGVRREGGAPVLDIR